MGSVSFDIGRAAHHVGAFRKAYGMGGEVELVGSRGILGNESELGFSRGEMG